jgi:leishmanolysin
MHFATTLLLVAVFLVMLLMTCSLLAKLRRYQTLPASRPLPLSLPRVHDLWWITLGDALRDDMHGPYVVLAPDGAEPSSPPSISVDSGKVTRTPSRGLIHEILLDRTGQLSSRGSPRKGDYILLDGD